MTIEEQAAPSEPTAPGAVVAQPQETTEAAPAAAELTAEQKTELDKTSAWVEGIRAKANRATAEPDAEAPEASGEGDDGVGTVPETAAGEPAKAAEGEAPTEEKPRRTLNDLHADHRARIERNQLKKENAKLQEKFDHMVAVLEGLQATAAPESASAAATQGAATTAEPAAAKEDPEPDFDLDPKDWHRWNERQLEQRLAEREQSFQRQLLDQLNPLIEGGKIQQQQAAQSAEAEAAQERSKAVAREVATLVDEYKETAEGAGYTERFNAYRDYFVGDLVARGASEAEAQQALQAEALDILLRGENEGQQPVAYYDAYIMQKARLAAGLPASLAPAATGKPAPQQPAAPAEPAKPAAPSTQQRKAESDLAAAAAAARLPEATAGHDRDAVSSGPSEVDIRQMAKHGKVTGDMIVNVAKTQGRDPMAVVREMLRAATG